MSMTQAQKHDDGKPRLDYLDPYALEEVAKVLTFGATKYGAQNWRKGIEIGRLMAACLRHIFAFMRGENNDPETGLSHLAHAMCCLMFTLWMLEHRRDMDDRSPNEPEVKAEPKITVEANFGKVYLKPTYPKPIKDGVISIP